MGAAAMTLSGGGEYAIHGTNNKLGRRLRLLRLHSHVQLLDLYSRVSWGTTVIVTR
jgi:hypothetical protein